MRERTIDCGPNHYNSFFVLVLGRSSENERFFFGTLKTPPLAQQHAADLRAAANVG
jgi:hypothetical protein